MIDRIEPIRHELETFEEGHFGRREEAQRRALERLIARIQQRRQPPMNHVGDAPAAPPEHEWRA